MNHACIDERFMKRNDLFELKSSLETLLQALIRVL